MRPEVDFAGRAIQGDRDNQEDFYAFEVLGKTQLLLVLADGAGGQASGEQASRSASLGFLDCFAAARDKNLPTLSTALASANQRLAEFIDKDPNRRSSMATTLLAVLVDGPSFQWISVGDSPLILFRDGRATRLNADHSGAGIPGDIKLPKNLLLSALVGGRIPAIDWRREPYALKDHDIIIAASDGLWTLTLDEIANALAGRVTHTASEIAHLLLHRLVEKGKPRQDNTTIAIIKATRDPGPRLTKSGNIP
jgi:protein phosphatase